MRKTIYINVRHRFPLTYKNKHLLIKNFCFVIIRGEFSNLKKNKTVNNINSPNNKKKKKD
jgi:hypothetical protein